MGDIPKLLFLAAVLLVSLAVFALLAAISSVLHLWLRATASGHAVPMMNLVALRLRGSPPNLILNAYLHLRSEGIPVTLFGVEAIYLAHRKDVRTLEDLVEQVRREWIARQPPAANDETEEPTDPESSS